MGTVFGYLGEYLHEVIFLCLKCLVWKEGFPGGSVVKNPPASAGDMGFIPGLGRGRGNGDPLQYSCRENSMDRGAWQAIVYGVTKSQTQLSMCDDDDDDDI